jgi:phage-related holin
MKTTTGILSITAALTFACTYFMQLTMDNAEQYLGLISVVFIDGFFGIIAGIKREGFQTRKALKVLQRAFGWVLILTSILMVEKGFVGAGWLSETIIIPFMVLQLVSALKNASMAGFIHIDELNQILDRIDRHKGIRQ